jgi:hypothetical protein
VSRRDSPEVNGPAPQRRQGMWSTVQAAITGGWGTTFRLLLILGGLATLVILAGHGAGTPILALLRLIR